MSQRRRVGIGVAVGLVAALLVLLYWHHRGSGDDTSGHAAGSAEAVAKGTDLGTVGKEVHKRPDPKTQPRGTIAGTVRDEAKAPIAGAHVCVDATSDALPQEITREPACKDTDATGAYKFDQLFAARYSVTAGAKTFRPATFHPDGDRHKSGFELAPGETKTVDLVLKKGGAEVTGTVSDISGGPIVHAQVHVTGGRWGQGESAPMVETDDKGAYSAWVAPGDVRVSAGADGYAQSTQMGRAPGKIDVLLTPESGLAGIVIDAKTNAPIEGAAVSVSATQWSWDGDESDKTDAQGKFRVHHLPPGRYDVIAHSDHGYGRTEGSVLVGLGQQVEGVTVKLFPAARVVGKVMIGSTPPELCPDGWVSLHDEAKDRHHGMKREPDGTLHADGVLPGTYTPQVWCEGYQAKDKYPPVVVADKDVTDLTWEVMPGATVKGRVLSKTGTPIADAEITGRSSGGDARAKMDWAGDRSQDDGSYELTGLKKSEYKIDVTTDQGVAPREPFKVDVPAAGVVTKDLVVDDGGTIKGIVVDKEGKPVDDVKIDARALSDQFFWNPNQIKSADDGTFTIDALRAGQYRVTARRSWTDELRKPGTNDDAEQGEKVTVEVGKVVNVKLVVETQTGTIKGTVVDADGQPVSDAFISHARESDAAGANASHAQATRSEAWSWGEGEKPVLTGVDGSFTIAKISPGTYTLRAYRKGGGEAITEHVAVGSTSARLQIKRTGSIEGTAHRSGPLPDSLAVQLEDLKTGFSRSESFFKTDGHFIIHDLPAGHFAVTVSVEGGQKKVDVDLAEGEQKTGVDVTLEELVTITGRVIDQLSKQPISGIMVYAQPAQTNTFSFGWNPDETDNITDASGHFTVKRAPKGKLSIQGMSRDWKESDYAWFRIIRTITDGPSVDLGDITMIKKRIKDGETPGKLGLHWKEQAPDTPPDQAILEVSFVEPNGPCADLDIKVGDVVVSVDGVDAQGENAANAYMLMNAPVGTKLALGLKRGPTISVTLAPP